MRKDLQTRSEGIGKAYKRAVADNIVDGMLSLDEPPLGGSFILRYNKLMFENRRTSRPFDLIGPFDPKDYTSDVPLGNNNPTNVQGKIYDTPGNTWLNRAKGGLVELPGKYTMRGDPFKNAW